MIKKLKQRFIILAMVSLAALLSLIVAGMNVINYSEVVNDADERIEVLEENSAMLLRFSEGDRGDGFRDKKDDFFFGRRGQGGPFMTRDEAEESRFFIIVLDEDNKVVQTNIDRIAAVDEDEAAEYAVKAAESGRDSGFVEEFRYHIDENGTSKNITFLDCGRVLDSYMDFLKASIMMSLLGLLLVFAIIVYFAGRIVRPVAESYEKQKRFITDAGHEIKTPLAIIKANLDVIKLDPESTEDSLEDISDQVDRLAGLTEDLVYLSRMEEADSSLVMTELPLSDIVSETVASFDALAREGGNSIKTDIAPMVSVKGSNKELEKLVSILMENALKYSPKGAEIKFSLQQDGKNAILEIANPSVQEVKNEDLGHVFERFYRTDTSRNSASGGHGIGLSMASAIVKAHGGRISARTSDGQDFIVNISIPAA